MKHSLCKKGGVRWVGGGGMFLDLPVHIVVPPPGLPPRSRFDSDFLRQGDTARTRKPSVVSRKQMSVLWAQLHAYKNRGALGQGVCW